MKRTISTALLCFAATTIQAQAAGQSFPALSAPGGRFVFGQVSDFQRDKFLLDTQTGRVWVMVCTDDKAAQCWRGLQSVPFLDQNGAITFTVPVQTK